MIDLENVTKTYDGRRVVGPISFSLERGRTTVLIGPSGCGKSTLLRMMIGLVKPDAGVIKSGGTEIQEETVQRIRRHTGYVIQEGGLFPHLTARENVLLMAMHVGWEQDVAADRSEELAKLTQFPADGFDRYPVQLSGGQRQRVSLMRALMLDPPMLLLDEPLGALDPMIRADLQRDLKRIFESLGKTVVMVTHDLGEAAFLGDRILLLQDGVVVQDGAVRQLIDSPANPFVTAFINAQRTPLEGTAS